MGFLKLQFAFLTISTSFLKSSSSKFVNKSNYVFLTKKTALNLKKVSWTTNDPDVIFFFLFSLFPEKVHISCYMFLTKAEVILLVE